MKYDVTAIRNRDRRGSRPPVRSILAAIYLLLLVIPLIGLTPTTTLAAERITIKKLKNLHLSTSLVEKGAARTVIVAPVGDRYGAEIRLVQQRVRQLTGVTLPVYRDEMKPEELLRGKNVIAVGNMATNAFIESLYRQWQVILDLKYPGEGGYVVRTLHDPFGTGRNVIFLGGSDDAGVAEATRLFAEGMQGNATALKTGGLMKIRLGKGLTPPVIGAYLQKWHVQSWSDSRRTAANGRTTGYDVSTFFGWNPVSIAGALYYLTGQKEYLETFRELALPDPQHLPLPNRTSDAFTDPANPLVKNYHYRSHLVDCIYDLIEESPLFTDSERLKITNKLLEHQYDLDPVHAFSPLNGDRHALWHMLCIYTGSRYFSTYYPDPVWQRRTGNVRRGFRSFIGNPTWGSQDTLGWVATSIEPLFEFFLLDGADEFVKSGTALSYMKGLEVLMTGAEIDDYNSSLPLNLLFRAAYLLKDSRYLWMANRLGADTGAFRIGQSYWPRDDAGAAPPTDLVGKVSVVPLARTDRQASGTPVPAAAGFQLLSYRSGLEDTDDYLLLDGFQGLGRHPYQVNTLSRLRMFGGRNVLSGYANDLSIWRNGMTEPHVARSADLKLHLETENFAFIQTAVPDMPGSSWERRILYLKERMALVVDKVVPREAGSFDVVTSWQMGGSVKGGGKPSRRFQSANGAAVVSADLPLQSRSASILQGRLSRDLQPGEPLTLATLFFSSASPKALAPLGRGGYLVSGTHRAYVVTIPVSTKELTVMADFAYIDSERIFLEGATELRLKGEVIFHSDRPVTLLWNLRDNAAVVSAFSGIARVRLTTPGRPLEAVVQAADQAVPEAVPPTALAGCIAALLTDLEAEVKPPEDPAATVQDAAPIWQPAWQVDLKQKITALAAAENGALWVASQGAQAVTLTRLGADSKPLTSVTRKGELLSMWPAQGERQSRAFSLLAGFKDDMLLAYAGDGTEIWSVQAAIHPSFIIGDRYDAPWFTDPKPPHQMTGVYSLLVGDLWGSGREEISLGRPCGVEFYSLAGKLNGRVATRWGTNTMLATMNATQGPLLLTGKGYCGSPSLSGITGRYVNSSDNLFYGALAPGYPNMHAWLQRKMSGMKVADINMDGQEELVYSLSGHWNELRVYDHSGKPLWMKFFGPDKLEGSAPFMSALALVDLDGSGRRAIIVGTRNGWVNAFDHEGNPLWQRQFASGITSMSARDERHLVAVGCEDGSLLLLDGSGTALAHGKLKGAVLQLAFTHDNVFAGSALGLLGNYPLPRN